MCAQADISLIARTVSESGAVGAHVSRQRNSCNWKIQATAPRGDGPARLEVTLMGVDQETHDLNQRRARMESGLGTHEQQSGHAWSPVKLMKGGFSLINILTEKTLRGSPFVPCYERCAMLEDCLLWTDRQGAKETKRSYSQQRCDLYRQDPDHRLLSKISMKQWGDAEGRSKFLKEFSDPDAKKVYHGFLGSAKRVAPFVGGFLSGYMSQKQEGIMGEEIIEGRKQAGMYHTSHHAFHY
jgi:hypothetical protein